MRTAGSVLAMLLVLTAASSARADDGEPWSFELAFRLGPHLSVSPDADIELESGAGLEWGMGPRFVAPSGWGLGLDVAADIELDGDAPSTTHFITEVYGMHRLRAGERDFVTLRLGPSFWYADAGTTAGCVTECAPAIEQRRDELDVHDTTVIAGVAGLSFSRGFGPILMGIDLRGRVGYALADDASPLRAHVLAVFHVTMRVPPDTDYPED